jgi:PTH1 family peptidyl-tRNA hydrolase
MNNSGECVRNFVNYWKISLENILIIYDDLSLSLGTFRYRQQGSSGGHNGVKSIIECLGTQKFPRLKVGIGSSKEILWKDWVLQKFNEEEAKEIKKILPELVDWLLKWVGTE